MRYRILVSLALLASPLAAQGFDTTTVSGRVMHRRLGSLEQALVGRDTSTDNIGRHVSRLNDTMLVAFAGLMADGVERIPPDHCDMLDGQDDIGFMTLLTGGADSLEAERWAALLREVLRLEVQDAPVGAVAPPDIAAAMILAVTTRTSPKEQEAFTKARRLRVQGPCLMMPRILHRVARKKPDHVGPILRFVFLTADRQ